MDSKHKRLRPKLDRRNAIKNIDYDASTSPSSSFDGQSSGLRTRSLDLSPLTDRTSFRIEGIDGEFDRICRSLGLSGPEDFAIPAAAWEARKPRSSFDQLPTSRFFNHHNSDISEPQVSADDDFSARFEARVRFSDGLELEHENECSNSTKYEARVRFSDEVKDVNDCSNSVTLRSSRDGGGGGGIKGVRPPPVLAPPPAMSRPVVDNTSSTWDILRSFAPQDDRDSGTPVRVGLISFSDEEDENFEKSEEVDGGVIERGELNAVVRLGETAVLSESCSYTLNGDHYSCTTPEPMYTISPNAKFRRSIRSWQKGDFLGSGSFGTVYEGFTDDGFFFAVKEVSLLDQGSRGKQSIFQLEQEISLLSRFEHDNIVQYFGTDKDEGKLYIFLELVTKGSLANLYQKYHLGDSQVSAYTRQILNGLKYLHERDVVHRDVKCANILVHASGSVKLADFGLAKATKLNDVKSCKGTAFWMAPEVVNQKNHGYGLAADIWSLGCTVLEMLTSQIPYSHLEGMQALFRIGKGETPSIPDSLSRDARDFILKCLQVNPDNRPTAAQLLDHPFMKRSPSTSLGPASPYYNGIRS